MCPKTQETQWKMKNEANTISTALLPRAAITECLEISQVFDLETCDDKIWICFELATDSVYLFEWRFDETCKHENNITISFFFVFPFFFLKVETTNSKKTNLDHSNMQRHRRFNSTKTTNARRPFAECSQAYFRPWWIAHWPETHMTVPFCFQPSSSSKLQSFEFPYHPE